MSHNSHTPIFANIPIMASPLIQELGINDPIEITEFIRNIYHRRPVICIEILSNDNTQKLSVLALIDSGASMSCITKKVAEKLNLRLDGNESIEFYDNENCEGSYLTSIVIKGRPTIPLKLYCFDAKRDSIDMIIGIDILSNFSFQYNTIKGSFSLKYPA